MNLRRAKGAVRWIVIASVVVVAASAALAGFWFSRPLVTVTHVVEGPVIDSFYATGTVQPVTEYPIKASSAGIVTRIRVDKGDHVTLGQVLAVVEDPQLQFQLDKANAELHQARRRAVDPKPWQRINANADIVAGREPRDEDQISPVLKEFDAKLEANGIMLNHAKHEVERYAKAGNDAASQTDKDKAADRVKDLWSQGESLAAQRAAAKLQLEADLSIAEARVVAARNDYDRQTLTSPIDGVVLDRPTPLGTRLNINDHLMQIADVRPTNLRMRAAVDEENKPDLRPGQLVHMALYAFPGSGKIFEGEVDKIYDKADTDRRTFEVDVKFHPSLRLNAWGMIQSTPDPRLAAGMTGELAFILNRKSSALIAPSQALQHSEIYTLRDGRLTRVEGAQIGIKSVERIEITAGLHAGDIIVISPILDIHEGAAVRTKMIDPIVAAGLNKPSSDSGRNPLGGH